MCFHLAIDLAWMWATTFLAQDGPLKTSLDEGLANSHNRTDIYLKGIANLLICPAMPPWRDIRFEQDARMAVSSVGQTASRNELLQLLALLN